MAANGIPTVEGAQRRAAELTTAGELIGRRFPRPQPPRRALGFIHGLLLDVQRENAWRLPQRLGGPSPHGVQHLLGRAAWDADRARDDLARYAFARLGDPPGVLAVDETGFLKKGGESAGARRQYPGTAGRVGNWQIGVFLAQASPKGRALLGGELYLPKGWAKDAARRKEARVPARVSFATKPRLARRPPRRAFAAGVTAARVTADEVYGPAGKPRLFLGRGRRAHVPAVKCDQGVWAGFRQVMVKALAREAPPGAWRRLSAGDGAKGPRLHGWAAPRVNCPGPEQFRRWPLARRGISDPTDLAYYLRGGPAQTTLQELVLAAGSRRAAEECLETGKGEVGLGQYGVRGWVGWYRHVTLGLFAQAMPTVIRPRAAAEAAPKKGGRGRRRR